MADTSLTEMVAVRPRGPKIFLAVLALAIVGGVVWWFFLRTPGPRGAPEDPAKVLVVGGDAAVADELAALGFEVEHGTFDDLEARARNEIDDLDATGPSAILALADELGAGHVAFADPSTLSFGSIVVTSSSSAVGPDHRWAVLSAGELAQPHPHVSVGRDDRLYPLPPTIELLRALFEQERLAATLVGEEKLAPIARPIFERVEPAIEILGGYGMADVKARKIDRARVESLEEPEEAVPKPAILADPLEVTAGFPVANGGIVLFSERPRLDSPRDPDVRLEYDGVAEAFWLPPGKTATSDREPCEAPIATVSPQGTVVNDTGDAMLVRLGERVEVWTMPADAKGCPFVRKGAIPDAPGAHVAVDGSGRVLRAVTVDDEQMVEVWAPGDSQPQVWPMSGCTNIGTPEWIDEEHFAIACRFDPPVVEHNPFAEPPPPEEPPPNPQQTWLYVSSTRTGQVLAWRFDVADIWLPELRLRRDPKLSLLADIDNTRLLLLAAAVDVAALFDTPLLDAALPRPPFVPEDEAGIVALAPTAFTTSQLEIDETAGAVVLSPTGTHAAFEIDQAPFDQWSTNVAVLDLASGRTKRVAIDRWAAHQDPRFTADGKTLVFVSAYEADNRTVTALRTVAVP